VQSAKKYFTKNSNKMQWISLIHVLKGH